MPSFKSRLDAILSDIELPENFSVILGRDGNRDDSRFYFQIECKRPDTYSGRIGLGRGGKAYLSPWATDSELIQTVFGLYKGYLEHEARESFLWRGRRVFGPHIATEALWEVAELLDVRPPHTKDSDHVSKVVAS